MLGTLRASLSTVWMCETLDSWESVMYINMYGCDQFGYTSLQGVELLRFSCRTPNAMGWASAFYFTLLVVFGGIVLPTVLIGLVSVVYEKTTTRVQEEALVDLQCSEVLKKAKGWYPQVDLSRAVIELRELFDMLDYTAGGELDYDEARPFLVHMIDLYLSTTVSEQQADLMFSAVLDVSGDKEINFAEFLWFVFLVFHQIGNGTPTGLGERYTEGASEEKNQLQLQAQDSSISTADDVKHISTLQQELDSLVTDGIRENESHRQREIERESRIEEIRLQVRKTVAGERRQSATPSFFDAATVDESKDEVNSASQSQFNTSSASVVPL